jgi:hypothetical protein
MNMTPKGPGTKVRSRKTSGTQPENGEAWIARIQALTVKETTSKAHMQVHTNKGSREKQPGRKPGPNRAEMGLGWPAWANRPSPLRARFSSPFFALGACLFIASASAGRHIHPFIKEPPTRRRSTRRKPLLTVNFRQPRVLVIHWFRL